MIEVIFYLIGIVTGVVFSITFIFSKKGGWVKLPQNTRLILTVDQSGFGHFWEPKMKSGYAELPQGKGMVKIDEESGIWLPDQKVKLFLHYIDYFRTIPPKHGAFFTFFKEKKKEIEEVENDDRKLETIERQIENQPGVIFNIRDVLNWVKKITPEQIMEGVYSVGLQMSGLKKLIFEEEKKSPWWILIFVIIGFFIIFLFIGGIK